MGGNIPKSYLDPWLDLTCQRDAWPMIKCQRVTLTHDWRIYTRLNYVNEQKSAAVNATHSGFSYCRWSSQDRLSRRFWSQIWAPFPRCELNYLTNMTANAKQTQHQVPFTCDWSCLKKYFVDVTSQQTALPCNEVSMKLLHSNLLQNLHETINGKLHRIQFKLR